MKKIQKNIESILFGFWNTEWKDRNELWMWKIVLTLIVFVLVSASYDSRERSHPHAMMEIANFLTFVERGTETNERIMGEWTKKRRWTWAYIGTNEWRRHVLFLLMFQQDSCSFSFPRILPEVQANGKIWWFCPASCIPSNSVKILSVLKFRQDSFFFPFYKNTVWSNRLTRIFPDRPRKTRIWKEWVQERRLVVPMMMEICRTTSRRRQFIGG